MVFLQGPLQAPWLACWGGWPPQGRPVLLIHWEVPLAPHQIHSQSCLANNIAESLAESAAAYTKATARKCLLEKVEVITGEEAESNVLQVRAAGTWGTRAWGGIFRSGPRSSSQGSLRCAACPGTSRADWCQNLFETAQG